MTDDQWRSWYIGGLDCLSSRFGCSALVTVTAPSRLHFGLYGFGNLAARQFGGVGAMIEAPRVKLTAAGAAQFSAVGPLAERVQEFAQRWTAFHSMAGDFRFDGNLPRAAIAVVDAPPEHSGLGVG